MNPYERFITGKDPMEQLAATPTTLAGLVDGLTPEQLAQSPAPGKWSIQDIIAHLADTEMVHSCRCRWIAFEDHPLLAPFDQDRWAAGRMRENESVAQSLARFEMLRAAQLRLFSNVDADGWDRTAQHQERGLQHLRDYPPLCAGHDINHIEQIEAIRRGLCGS